MSCVLPVILATSVKPFEPSWTWTDIVSCADEQLLDAQLNIVYIEILWLPGDVFILWVKSNDNSNASPRPFVLTLKNFPSCN